MVPDGKERSGSATAERYGAAESNPRRSPCARRRLNAMICCHCQTRLKLARRAPKRLIVNRSAHASVLRQLHPRLWPLTEGKPGKSRHSRCRPAPIILLTEFPRPSDVPSPLHDTCADASRADDAGSGLRAGCAGCTTVTLIPCGPSSSARFLVIAATATFLMLPIVEPELRLRGRKC